MENNVLAFNFQLDFQYCEKQCFHCQRPMFFDPHRTIGNAWLGLLSFRGFDQFVCCEKRPIPNFDMSLSMM